MPMGMKTSSKETIWDWSLPNINICGQNYWNVFLKAAAVCLYVKAKSYDIQISKTDYICH